MPNCLKYYSSARARVLRFSSGPAVFNGQFLIVSGISTGAHAGVIFVDDDNYPGDGSVGDPYCSIQTAINNTVDTGRCRALCRAAAPITG